MKHAIVWIDQKEARLFEVEADQVVGGRQSDPAGGPFEDEAPLFHESAPRRGP
jgi:hypothetical protein